MLHDTLNEGTVVAASVRAKRSMCLYAARTEASPDAAASASARCLRPSNIRRVMINPAGSIADVSNHAQGA